MLYQVMFMSMVTQYEISSILQYLVSFNMTWIDHPVCGRAVPRFFITDENIQFLSEKYVSIIPMYFFTKNVVILG